MLWQFVDAMEEDLEDFELSSTEDETIPTTHTEVVEQNHLRDPQDSLEENYHLTSNDWDIDEPEPPMTIGVESNHAIRTSTTSMAVRHETPNLRLEQSIGRTASLPQAQNPMSLEYLASPMSSSFSLLSSGSQNDFSSKGTVQQHPGELVSLDSMDGFVVPGADKQYLLKVFLEKSSSWVR